MLFACSSALFHAGQVAALSMLFDGCSILGQPSSLFVRARARGAHGETCRDVRTCT